MNDRNRHKSSIGFTDLLFNLVIGFVYLFMIAFILINPVAKTQDIPNKADWLVVIEWDPIFNDDIDLWVQDPSGNKVSFTRREHGLMHLERDDLGHTSDQVTYPNPDGTMPKTIVLPINKEVVTLRGTIPGEYIVMAHVYSRNFAPHPDGGNTKDYPGWIRFSLVQVNPYIEGHVEQFEYEYRGQQFTLLNFTLDDDGEFVRSNKRPHSIITRTRTGTSTFRRMDNN